MNIFNWVKPIYIPTQHSRTSISQRLGMSLAFSSLTCILKKMYPNRWLKAYPTALSTDRYTQLDNYNPLLSSSHELRVMHDNHGSTSQQTNVQSTLGAVYITKRTTYMRIFTGKAA
jgi:hypothetical protein